MRIEVRGNPAPQGSKKYVGQSKKGHAVLVEMCKSVKPWRQGVKAAVFDSFNAGRGLDEPLIVRMVFSFIRPRSHYRTGKNAHLLKDGVPRQPQGTPDLSKLLRSTEDALTDAGVWRDDARVVEYERAAKVWCGEDPESLSTPGAVIVIRRLSETVGRSGLPLSDRDLTP